MCTHKISSPDDEICAGIPRNSVTSKRLFPNEKNLLFSSLFAKTHSYLETRPIDHLFINFLLRRNKNVWENMKNNSSELTFQIKLYLESLKKEIEGKSEILQKFNWRHFALLERLHARACYLSIKDLKNNCSLQCSQILSKSKNFLLKRIFFYKSWLKHPQ